MSRVLTRVAVDTLLVGAILFGAAGTFGWFRGWVLLGVMTCIRGVSAIIAYRVNPELMRERAGSPLHRDQSRTDRVLVMAILGTGFLGLPLVAALDFWHWHLLPSPSAGVQVFGLACFGIGWMLKGAALRANAFAAVPVRLQHERAHAVADAGPYAVVRHPFYAADLLIHGGLALWLGSSFTLACALIPVGLMVWRLRMEERFLLRELRGYAAYASRVPYRLVPGLW